MAAGFTSAGLTHLLTTEYPPATGWYLGLINNSPSPTFSTGDILGTHPGWVEETPGTAYSGNRPLWTNGAVSANATTNASTVNFLILITTTVYGLFLCSAATGGSGTLACTAAFSGGTQAVANGDTLQTTLTISAASG